MLPPNIEAITPDEIPSGVFLYPLCTSRENFALMLVALDAVYKDDKENVGVIKDFLNAQQFVSDPLNSVCLQEALGGEILIDVRLNSDGTLEKKFYEGDWLPAGEIEFPPAILTASATTLAPGEAATAEIVGTELQLGIPAGFDGAQGIQGETGAQGIQGETGAQGIQGETGERGFQGIQGIPGEDGQSAISPAPTEPVMNVAENICAGAVGLIDFLIDKTQEVFDAEELRRAQTESDVNTGLAIAEILSGGLLELVPVDEVWSFIQDQAAISSAIIGAKIQDSTMRDDLICSLYCFIKDTLVLGGGEFTRTMWNEFINSMPGGTDGSGFVKWAFWKYNFDDVVRRYWLYQLETSSYCTICDLCDSDGWEEVFDFVADQTLQGWTAKGSFPTPNATGSGLEATVFLDTSLNPDVSRRAVYIGKTLTYADTTTRVAEMRVDYSGGSVGNSNATPASYFAPRIRLNESANIATAGNTNIAMPSGSTEAAFTTQPQVLNTHYALCHCNFGQFNGNTGQPVTGSGFVTKITLRGTGKNPFVA